MFSYVTLGDLRHFGNNDSMGQNAGCLGRVYDPFTVPFVRPITGALDLRASRPCWARWTAGRMDGRRRLLEQMTRAGARAGSDGRHARPGRLHRQAYELLASPACRDAFDLAREPDTVRDALRPRPASARTACWPGGSWRRACRWSRSTRSATATGTRTASNFPTLKNTLLPPTDQGLSALLEDLSSRGLLDETLVVWMGDMGRTPRINNGGGRDHWSFCYSIVMAGGGVRGGQVYGSSDRTAAYPSTNPVGPADVAATIYHCLGIDPRGHVTDQQGRPLVVSTGKPILPLLG